MARPLVFCIATRKADIVPKLHLFTDWLGTKVGVAIEAKVASSYEELARSMREEAVDVAWLPPIVFVHLEREGTAVPLVSNWRAGLASYHAALVVPQSMRIHTLLGLQGARAVWVDPFSASGYVLPRLQLVALGIDPRQVFSEERFVGSHEGVVRELMEGRADVGATYATVNEAGVAVRGGWTDVPGGSEQVRVLTTFGTIPGDLVAAHVKLEPSLAEAFSRALVAVGNDPGAAALAREVLGVEEFHAGGGDSYGALRRAVADAAMHGLLESLGMRPASLRP
jgi:phosphate/phosphite/phosphonate ABC transporter binding protein